MIHTDNPLGHLAATAIAFTAGIVFTVVAFCYGHYQRSASQHESTETRD